MNRYALRKDANQDEIVSALEKIGASVYVMHQPLDLLVGFRGKNFLLECKIVQRRGHRNNKTPAQIRFIDGWHGHHAVVYTISEAIEVVTGLEG